MKIQIIKIIPCLVAGFILSACVGAVNLDEGATHPCIASPFSDSCDSAEFNDARKAVCVGSNSERCIPIIMRVCEADSLDALCADRETYYPAQETACRDEPDSERCAPIITRSCEQYPLQGFCKGKEAHYPAQKTACENPATWDFEVCIATYKRICDEDVFNSYCVESEAHYPAQRTACESEPNSERCVPIIARSCRDDVFNPFSTSCQSINLNASDLQLPPRSRTSSYRYFGCIYIYGDDCGETNVWEDLWGDLINITPLTDTNTGNAIYRGVFNVGSVKYEDSDIIVNFDNNTLSYSVHNKFSITGSFTDRGIITGVVSDRSSRTIRSTSLRGLIGQTEMMGVFSGQLVQGGFRATRQ